MLKMSSVTVTDIAGCSRMCHPSIILLICDPPAETALSNEPRLSVRTSVCLSRSFDLLEIGEL